MIPDIKIYEVVRSCVLAIRKDFESTTVQSDTILWYLLNTAKQEDTGKYSWFTQAVEIFITRDEEHPKYLDTRLFFDRERAAIPTIHVMMNGESKGKDGIGVDLGYIEEQVIAGSQRGVLNRQFDINSNIIITSDNTFETVIIYHVIKSMLVSLMTHIQLVGFINPVIGGRDINISQELVPNGIYARTINFSAGYELSVPEACFNRIVSTVWLQMGNINNTPIPPTGPGPITLPSNRQTDVTPINKP